MSMLTAKVSTLADVAKADTVRLPRAIGLLSAAAASIALWWLAILAARLIF